MSKFEDAINHNLAVHVLFQFSQKTGKISSTMTAMGSALLMLWAMENTPKTKGTIIIERDTGRVKMVVEGQNVKKFTERDGEVLCTDFGIPLEMVQEIKDDRFDDMA